MTVNTKQSSALLHATLLALQGLKYMMKEEGIRGMFKGNGTNCVRIIPNAALKFLTYEQLTRCGLAFHSFPSAL